MFTGFISMFYTEKPKKTTDSGRGTPQGLVKLGDQYVPPVFARTAAVSQSVNPAVRWKVPFLTRQTTVTDAVVAKLNATKPTLTSEPSRSKPTQNAGQLTLIQRRKGRSLEVKIPDAKTKKLSWPKMPSPVIPDHIRYCRPIPTRYYAAMNYFQDPHQQTIRIPEAPARAAPAIRFVQPAPRLRSGESPYGSGRSVLVLTPFPHYADAIHSSATSSDDSISSVLDMYDSDSMTTNHPGTPSTISPSSSTVREEIAQFQMDEACLYARTAILSPLVGQARQRFDDFDLARAFASAPTVFPTPPTSPRTMVHRPAKGSIDGIGSISWPASPEITTPLSQMPEEFFIQSRMQQWTFAGGYQTYSRRLHAQPRPVCPLDRTGSQGLVSFPALASPPMSVSFTLTETDVQSRRPLSLGVRRIIVALPPSGAAAPPIPAKSARRLTAKRARVVSQIQVQSPAEFLENPRKAPTPPGTRKPRPKPISPTISTGDSASTGKGNGKARRSSQLTPYQHLEYLQPTVYAPAPARPRPKSNPNTTPKLKPTPNTKPNPKSKRTFPPTPPSPSTLSLPHFFPRKLKSNATTHQQTPEIIAPLYKRLSGNLTLEEAIRAHIRANETRYRVLRGLAGYERPAQQQQADPRARSRHRTPAPRERKYSVWLSPVAAIAELKRTGEVLEIRGWAGASDFERGRRGVVSFFQPGRLGEEGPGRGR